MAKVFSAPQGFDPPEFDFRKPYEEFEKLENAYIARLRAEAKRWEAKRGRTNRNDSMIGEEVGFPAGDGYARYIVWNTSPLELVHLAVGDAWNIPAAYARGLRLADIKQQVEHRKNSPFRRQS